MAPIINDHYPGLAKIPWIGIGEYPSRVDKLKALGDMYGFPELYIKRDDLCHRVYGGNKVRKLEYVLADAKAKGACLLITMGASGSNQVLATGIHGGEQGFEVMGVMFDQPNADYVRKNLLLDHYFSIDIKYSSGIAGELVSLGWNYVTARVERRKPYFITAGASSSLGNLGFVNAVYELSSQVEEGVVPEIDYIVVAAGSLGTSAGLDLGCRLLGMKTRVVAVVVSMPFLVNRFMMARMVRNIDSYMRRYDQSVPTVDVGKEDLILPSDYVGKDYAYFTEPSVKMVADMRELEGIHIDPTYTGKAFSGGLDWLGKKGENDKTVLFWDTYNSVDLSPLAAQVDYRDLPRSFHKYFEEPTQEETFKKRS